MCNCSDQKVSSKSPGFTDLRMNPQMNIFQSKPPYHISSKYITLKDYYLEKFMRSTYYYNALKFIGNEYKLSNMMIQRYSEGEVLAYDLNYKDSSNPSIAKHLALLVYKSQNLYFPVILERSGSFSAERKITSGTDGQLIAAIGLGSLPDYSNCQLQNGFGNCWNCIVSQMYDTGGGWCAFSYPSCEIAGLMHCALRIPGQVTGPNPFLTWLQIIKHI